MASFGGLSGAVFLGAFAASAAGTAVGAPDPDRMLAQHLAGVLEAESARVSNDCTAGDWLLAALDRAAGDDRARLLRRLRALPRQPDGPYAHCFYPLASRLVAHLPRAERGAAAARLLPVIEQNRMGYYGARVVLPGLVPFLGPAHLGRLERYARRADTHCCLRTIVLGHLAAAGKVPLRDAVGAAMSCREECVADLDHLLPILPLLDQVTRDQLLHARLEALDDGRGKGSPGQLHVLRELAPYLPEHRRHRLMGELFRAMPALGIQDGGRMLWGDLPPQFHFWAVLTALAPLLTTDLVDAALASLPTSWEPASRAYIVGELAAALRPEVRRQKLAEVQRAIAGPGDSLHYVRARLMIASDLPPGEVRSLLGRFLQLHPNARERTDMLARLYPVVPPAERAGIADRLRSEIARMQAPYDRGNAAFAALEILRQR